MNSLIKRNLNAWKGLDLAEKIDQGARNEVWRGFIDGERVSVRQSRRSLESLEWELKLIEHLDAVGFRVPRVLHTASGVPHSEGVVVQEWMDGHPPRDESEWKLAVTALEQLHRATWDFSQRPDCCTVTQLAVRRRSVDANIDVMPASARRKVLAALAPLNGFSTSVVHGDPGASNVRISERGIVGFLDWDESRYEVSALDLVGLPIQVLDDKTHSVLSKAHHAWEAANGWTTEPEYARRQLLLLDGPDQP